MSTATPHPKELVVLLHGIYRTSLSMTLIGAYLRFKGYDVVSFTYPSILHNVRKLSEIVETKLGRHPKAQAADHIHFVSHSLGALVIRHMLNRNDDLKRRTRHIVMLVPPNRGSALADYAAARRWARPLLKMFGPAGIELTTFRAADHPDISGSIGIIAGNGNYNPLAKQVFGDKKHDGTVGHDTMILPDMQDFCEVKASHTSILCSLEAMRQINAFLQSGKFIKPPTIRAVP